MSYNDGNFVSDNSSFTFWNLLSCMVKSSDTMAKSPLSGRCSCAPTLNGWNWLLAVPVGSNFQFICRLCGENPVINEQSCLGHRRAKWCQAEHELASSV